MKTIKHFRLYMLEPDGKKLWDADEWLSYNRLNAVIYDGDEEWAEGLACDRWQIEWFHEDEELNAMGAERLPGLT